MILTGAALWLLPGSLSAHSGAPFGTHPFFEDGELIGGGTDYGMLLLEEGVPLWTCEEAFEFEPSWWYRAPHSRTLAGTYLGLRWSDDGGCSWQSHDWPLGFANTSSVGADPDDPLHVFLTTAGSGTDNMVYESLDGGQSFSETGLVLDGIRLRAIAVAHGAQELWVLGIREADAIPLLTRSTDGGATWSSELYALDGWGIAELRGLSEDEGRLLVSAQNPTGEFHLLEISSDLASPPEVSEQGFEAPLNVVTDFGGSLFLVSGWTEHFVRTEGAELFEERSEGPQYCITKRDGLLWGCGLAPTQAQFSQSQDGLGWQNLIEFADVVPRSCPEGSRAQLLCPPIWKKIRPGSGDDDDSSEGGDDDDSSSAGPEQPGPGAPGAGNEDCSCSSTGEIRSNSSALRLALLVLPLLARRRK